MSDERQRSLIKCELAQATEWSQRSVRRPGEGAEIQRVTSLFQNDTLHHPLIPAPSLCLRQVRQVESDQDGL